MPLKPLEPLASNEPHESIQSIEDDDMAFDFTKWMDMANLFSELVEKDEPVSKPLDPLPSNPIITPFDQTLANPQINIVKAVIPYLPVPHQRIFAIFIKSLELKKVFDLYPTSQLSSLSNPFPRSSDWKTGILKSIHPYCPKEKQKIVDMMLQLLQMKQMIGKTQTLYETFNNSNKKDSSMENITNLLSKENQEQLLKLIELFSPKESL
mgnify:CR=1 FL=1